MTQLKTNQLRKEEWRKKEEQRMELYRKGFTDSEIARQVGASLSTIQQWRTSRGLPRNYNYNSSMSPVPMEQALSPEGCEIVRTFLRMLVHVTKNCPPGTRFHVGKFMEEWRDIVFGARRRITRLK